MINLLKGTGNLSAHLRATNQALPLLNTVGATVPVKEEAVVEKKPQGITNVGLRQNLHTGQLLVTSSLISGVQVRFYHPSKLEKADFSPYLRDWGKDTESTRDKKAVSSYIAAGLALSSTFIMAKHTVRQMVGTLAPTPAALSFASIEVDLNKIPEGKSALFKWRGRPVFIRHRTGEEISREQAVNVSELRDPQADQDRVQQPEWLVVIGVCTHLGCTPIADAGDFGGYYCPCHGSHYDGSGRIRKGPAPLNLEVPAYQFKENGLLVVG